MISNFGLDIQSTQNVQKCDFQNQDNNKKNILKQQRGLKY